MKRASDVAGLLASFALAGCAPFCGIQVETFSKVTPANRTAGVESHADGPRHTVLELASGIKLDVGSCMFTRVCVTISLPEGRRMQFASDEFLELDGEGVNVVRAHNVPRIYFAVTCEESRTASRTCSSSERSPTAQPVEVKAYPKSEYDGWKYQLFWKSFDSRLEFVGADEIKGSLLRPLLSYRGSRQYEMRIPIDKKPGGKPYVLRLPKVLVDGVPYRLPDIRIDTVREEVCRTPPV